MMTIQQGLCVKYVLALVLLTSFDHSVGQPGFYSGSRRPDGRAPYNQRYPDRQWQPAQPQSPQRFDNRNTFTNTDPRGRGNIPVPSGNNRVNYRQNEMFDRNNQLNNQYRSDNFQQSQRQQQPIQPQIQRQRQQMNNPQNERNVYQAQSPFPSRGNNPYNGDQNMRINNYEPPVQNNGYPNAPRQMFQQNGGQSNMAARGGRNTVYNPVDQNQQPQMYQRPNNVYPSNGGQNFATNTIDRSFRNPGPRDNNVLMAAPRSGFSGERNEFQYRPNNFRTEISNDPFPPTDNSRTRYNSQPPVQIDRYVPYDERYGRVYDRTYNIPEAKTLPRGLEFAGQAYIHKREMSLDSFGNKENPWIQSSTTDHAISALGSVLGISTTTITDIASKPAVFVRSLQSAQNTNYPITDVSVVVQDNGIQYNNRDDKSRLLASLGNRIDRFAMEDKLRLYKNWDQSYPSASRSKYKYDMPVEMIIISDSNTFSELQAKAANTGSFIGALPPSAIDENLFSVKSKPRVIVRNTADNDKDTKDKATDTKTTQAIYSPTATVKVVTKSPAKTTSAAQYAEPATNLPLSGVKLLSSNPVDYTDGFINLLNDLRW